ncbi:MAG TPA: MauE/DoxX family redox-associated membrane protein [Candidatus Acidoferrales bacterium]|nr:MauE/DoxX family redox-associated membrane protein [Candidatus Acidoferrales bacterium]
MNDSMAQPQPGLVPLDLAGWKTALSWVSAILLAVLFLASGLWKVTDAQGAAVRMAQARIPESLSLAAAILFGVVETSAGVLVLIPRYRRWGAALTALLLVAFLVYFALNYNALRGAECSCFPWVKRAVGPGFFVGDGVMLLLAALAGLWSKPPHGLRYPLVIAGTVAVFAVVSYGVTAVRQTGTPAPQSVMVDAKPYSLEHGKIFLFFFDPACMHCFDAAKRMSQYHWGDTRVIGIPISQPQWAAQFMKDTGFHMDISSDLEKLKQVFPYTAVPAGVALESGREKGALVKFEAEEPEVSLRQLGFVK